MKTLNKGIISVLAVLVSLTASYFPADAETVSQKQALAIAEAFFNASRGMKMASPKMVYNGRNLTTNRLFAPFYVYNHPTGGFVIVSAENKAYPILAFSLTDKFDQNKIKDGLKALLGIYAIQIEKIRYDATPVNGAIAAWGNIPVYIKSILDSSNNFTDLIEPWSESEKDVDEAADRADFSDLLSDIYTPAQWSDMINEGLGNSRNVVMGFQSGDTFYPGVVTGRKGDYYRLYFGSPGNANYRLFPTEVLSAGELALTTGTVQEQRKEFEEEPFSFYRSFIESRRDEAAEAARAIQNTLLPQEPVVEAEGSGHFRITLPKDVVLARVYDVAGSLINEQTFKGTQVANVDLTNAAQGFYLALLFDVDGTPYGFKLYR